MQFKLHFPWHYLAYNQNIQYLTDFQYFRSSVVHPSSPQPPWVNGTSKLLWTLANQITDSLATHAASNFSTKLCRLTTVMNRGNSCNLSHFFLNRNPMTRQKKLFLSSGILFRNAEVPNSFELVTVQGSE